MRLVFKDAEVIKLTQYPGVDGDTMVLGVSSLLTRTLAEQLGCRDNCFAESGVPRRFVDLKLTGLVIEQCEIDLDGQVLLASKVQSFKVARPASSSESDASLEISCNLHFAYCDWLGDWAHRRNKGQFDASITPPPTWNAQESLFQQADQDVQPEQDESHDGSVDAVIEARPDDGQEPIPLHGDALAMHNGMMPADESKEPSVAPRERPVGAPQRRKRGERPGVVEIGVGVTAPPKEIIQ